MRLAWHCVLLSSRPVRLHQGNSAVWSSVLGAAGTALTLACWRSRREVFLDRICISETDDLKAEAICSLAGILDKSESMLVLWDACSR